MLKGCSTGLIILSTVLFTAVDWLLTAVDRLFTIVDRMLVIVSRMFINDLQDDNPYTSSQLSCTRILVQTCCHFHWSKK